jgi:hypothetical protein
MLMLSNFCVGNGSIGKLAVREHFPFIMLKVARMGEKRNAYRILVGNPEWILER